MEKIRKYIYSHFIDGSACTFTQKKPNLIAGNSVISTKAPIIKDHVISCKKDQQLLKTKKLYTSHNVFDIKKTKYQLI